MVSMSAPPYNVAIKSEANTPKSMNSLLHQWQRVWVGAEVTNVLHYVRGGRTLHNMSGYRCWCLPHNRSH